MSMMDFVDTSASSKSSQTSLRSMRSRDSLPQTTTSLITRTDPWSAISDALSSPVETTLVTSDNVLEDRKSIESETTNDILTPSSTILTPLSPSLPIWEEKAIYISKQRVFTGNCFSTTEIHFPIVATWINWWRYFQEYPKPKWYINTQPVYVQYVRTNDRLYSGFVVVELTWYVPATIEELEQVQFHWHDYDARIDCLENGIGGTGEFPRLRAIYPSMMFLEGVTDGTGHMRTDLVDQWLLPWSQPYNTAPWYYTGTETLNTTSGVVDRVLVEARDISNPDLVLAKFAWVLMYDGRVIPSHTVDDFNKWHIFIKVWPFYSANTILGSWAYVSVRHRNHVDIIGSTYHLTWADTHLFPYIASANPQTLIMWGTGQLTQDLYGNWTLKAGDANGDGIISSMADFSIYSDQSSAVNQYLSSDFNLDGSVTVADFNLLQPNISHIGISYIRY